MKAGEPERDLIFRLLQNRLLRVLLEPREDIDVFQLGQDGRDVIV